VAARDRWNWETEVARLVDLYRDLEAWGDDLRVGRRRRPPALHARPAVQRHVRFAGLADRQRPRCPGPRGDGDGAVGAGPRDTRGRSRRLSNHPGSGLGRVRPAPAPALARCACAWRSWPWPPARVRASGGSRGSRRSERSRPPRPAPVGSLICGPPCSDRPDRAFAARGDAAARPAGRPRPRNGLHGGPDRPRPRAAGPRGRRLRREGHLCRRREHRPAARAGPAARCLGRAALGAPGEPGHDREHALCGGHGTAVRSSPAGDR